MLTWRRQSIFNLVLFPLPMDGGKHTIAMVWRGAVEALPPAMSLAKQLVSAGCDVSWICGTASNSSVQRLEQWGVRCIPLGIRSTGDEPLFDKVSRAFRFRKEVWRRIDDQRSPTTLWVLNGETAVVLGRKLLQRKYVLHLYELYEGRLKRMLADRFVRGARAMVCAGAGRADLIRSWHRLSRTPLVINNLPVPESAAKCQEIEDEVAKHSIQAALANGERIVLYQGLLREDRDLSVYCRFFNNRRGWRLVLMGRDFNCVGRMKALCPSLIHIDHIDAPKHLQVTSWASLGVVAYDDNCLNNRLCAPNKIYEYGLFGIPMLANDVPGLTNTVGRYNAGVCAVRNIEDVAHAVDMIEENNERFSTGSRSLYEAAAAHSPVATGQALELCNSRFP